MEALHKLLMHELEDLYDAEQQILKALPKMIQEASNRQLQQALTEHRTITERQVERLDEVFRELDGEGRSRRKCKGMAGLIAEGEDLLKEDFEDATKDAGIIGAAQRVEHYEIAAYGTARTLAQFLGNRRAAQLLEETLEEEKEADLKLTQIAESSTNREAADEEETSGSGDGGGYLMTRAGSARAGRGAVGTTRSRKSSARAKPKAARRRTRGRSKANR